MRITDLLQKESIALNQTPASKQEAMDRLIGLHEAAGNLTDVQAYREAIWAREKQGSTAVGSGIAIPHAKSSAVARPALAALTVPQGVDFEALDGMPSRLLFMIAAPPDGDVHLEVLSRLMTLLMDPAFCEALLAAQTPEEFLSVIDCKDSEKAAETAPAKQSGFRVLAVTACPTGIAHTYMAADALTQTAAERSDVDLQVETQGSSNNTSLSQATIDAADAVIFATDVGVRDRERFAGKPVIESGVKRGINEPGKMLDEAIAASKNPNAHKVAGTAGAASASSAQEEGAGLGWGKRIQQAIMTGVSYMVPFVAAGGLLLALGFLFGGYDMANGWGAISTQYSLTNLPGHDVDVDGTMMTFDRSGFLLYIGAVLFATGQAAMGFIVAALSGYIAFALAGRPGIAPGFVGGAIAVTLGAGFIGGLVTGLIAGLVAMWIGNWKVPRWLGSLMPVVIIPLLASLVTGLLMYLVLGAPLEAIMNGLQNWLSSMSGSSAVLLGIILGLMMGFDLGGPVNKAAYLFATAGLSTGDEASMQIMAAVMAAGMVPPIALSIATFLRKNLFTPAEQENGKSSWLLGLSFVSEGAIPFAAADPLRVIPSMMVGGAVTGALSMAFHVGSRAPHGGIFVFFAIDPIWGWIIALLAGIAVSTLAVIAMKQFWPNKTAEAEAAKAEAAAA